jgi:hypothetical protein
MEQRNTHFSCTVTVNNSIEKVWETLIDVSTWHLWDTELIEAKLDGKFEVGAKGTMIPKKGPKLKFYISEMTPKHSYTIDTIMPVGKLVIKRNLKYSDAGILFTDDIQFKGFLKSIFGLILGGKFRKVLPEVLHKFKIIVERNI